MYPTSENSELYEFKMALFDNGDPEEFLLFIRNLTLLLSHQEQFLLEQISSIFVRWYMEKRYTRLTHCLLR